MFLALAALNSRTGRVTSSQIVKLSCGGSGGARRQGSATIAAQQLLRTDWPQELGRGRVQAGWPMRAQTASSGCGRRRFAGEKAEDGQPPPSRTGRALLHPLWWPWGAASEAPGVCHHPLARCNLACSDSCVEASGR